AAPPRPRPRCPPSSWRRSPARRRAGGRRPRPGSAWRVARPPPARDGGCCRRSASRAWVDSRANICAESSSSLIGGTVTDPIDALERSFDQLAKVVANLSPDQLALPTSCPDWDVRALLNHTLGGG